MCRSMYDMLVLPLSLLAQLHKPSTGTTRAGLILVQANFMRPPLFTLCLSSPNHRQEALSSMRLLPSHTYTYTTRPNHSQEP